MSCCCTNSQERKSIIFEWMSTKCNECGSLNGNGKICESCGRVMATMEEEVEKPIPPDVMAACTSLANQQNDADSLVPLAMPIDSIASNDQISPTAEAVSPGASIIRSPEAHQATYDVFQAELNQAQNATSESASLFRAAAARFHLPRWDTTDLTGSFHVPLEIYRFGIPHRVRLDFTQAHFVYPVTTIPCGDIHGKLSIIVPVGVAIRDDRVGFGNKKQHVEGGNGPSPLLVLTGINLFGNVHVSVDASCAPLHVFRSASTAEATATVLAPN